LLRGRRLAVSISTGRAFWLWSNVLAAPFTNYFTSE
jgi:hypothetical protein